MGKVFNVVGSYFGKAELIPEGSQLIEFSVDTLASDKDYFEGETYQEGDIKFHARFLLPDGTKSELISIPPSEVKCNQDLTKPFQRDPNLGLDETQAAPMDLDFYYKHEEITKYAPSFRIYIYPSEFILDHIEIEKIGADSDYYYYSGDPFKNETIIVRACNKDNTLKVTLPYNQNPSTTSKSCYYNINPNVVYREDIGTPVGENIREIPFRIECILRRAGSGNGEQRMEGTVPVKVLKQSKKMQFTDIQRIGSIFKSKYFDGDLFDNQGLRIMGKYPWDDRETDITEKCTIKALYNGQLYEQANKIPYARDLGENGGKGKVVITFVDEDNGGKVTTSDEFPEFESRLTFDIYAVNEVILNEPPSTKKFYVGDKIHNIPNPSVVTTQESLITNVTVKYIPAATNPDTTSKNFVIRVESSIDGIYLAGTLKKPGALTFKALYYDKNGREHKSNTITINVEKQIKQITPPTVNNNYNIKYSNADGSLKLNEIRLFNSGGGSSSDSAHLNQNNIFKSGSGSNATYYDWIDKVQINDTSYGRSEAGAAFAYTLQRGVSNISITLRESDENFQYQWNSSDIEEGTLVFRLNPITIYQTASLRVTRSSGETSSIIEFIAKDKSSYDLESETLTITTNIGIPINIASVTSPSSIRDYIDISYSGSDCTITPNVSQISTNGSLHSGTIYIYVETDEQYIEMSDSISRTVRVNNKKPFNWDEDVAIDSDWAKEIQYQSITFLKNHLGNLKKIQIGPSSYVDAVMVDWEYDTSNKNEDEDGKKAITFAFVNDEIRYFNSETYSSKYNYGSGNNPNAQMHPNDEFFVCVGGTKSDGSTKPGLNTCIWNKINDEGSSYTYGTPQRRTIKLNKNNVTLTKNFVIYPPTGDEIGVNLSGTKWYNEYHPLEFKRSSSIPLPYNGKHGFFIFNVAWAQTCDENSNKEGGAFIGRNVVSLYQSKRNPNTTILRSQMRYDTSFNGCTTHLVDFKSKTIMCITYGNRKITSYG